MTDPIGRRAFLGLGSGMVGPAIRRVVIARDPDRIGENLGKQGSFDISGFVLGPTMAAVLSDSFDFHAPFVVLTVLYVVIFFVGMRLDLSATRTPSHRRALRTLLALPPIRAALSASIAFYITIGMFEAVWALMLRDLGAGKRLTGITLSLFTVPMIFLAPTGGRFAQRFGPLRVASTAIWVAGRSSSAPRHRWRSSWDGPSSTPGVCVTRSRWRSLRSPRPTSRSSRRSYARAASR